MKKISHIVCCFPVLLGMTILLLPGCGSGKLGKETATALLDSIAIPETVEINIVSNSQDEFMKLVDSRSERISGWRNLQGDLKSAGLITVNIDERNESRQRAFFRGSDVWTIVTYSANITPLGSSLILDQEIAKSLNGQSGYITGKAIVGYWKMTGIDGIFQEKPEIAEIDVKYVFEKTPFYDICEQHSGTPRVKPYYLFEHLKFGVNAKEMNEKPKPSTSKVIKYTAKKYEDGQWKIDLPPSAVKLAPSANNLDEIEEIDLNPDGDVVSESVNSTSAEECNTDGVLGFITGNSVRVRSSPDSRSTTNILFQVNKGDNFWMKDIQENHLGESWTKACFDGKIGWVNSDFTELTGG
jgi:hypothetical protein